jgi:hypothetical protein
MSAGFQVLTSFSNAWVGQGYLSDIVPLDGRLDSRMVEVCTWLPEDSSLQS